MDDITRSIIRNVKGPGPIFSHIEFPCARKFLRLKSIFEGYLEASGDF